MPIPTVTAKSTARRVEDTRRELLSALRDRQRISGKVTAYTAAIRAHREFIFADVLRDAPAVGSRM